MIRNYLKIAFRNLWKSKGFSAINIIGLAIGLGTCLLIILFVLDELSFDKHNDKADRIYRVDGDIKFGGNHFILAVAPAPMGPALIKDYPQVEQFVRFRDQGGFMVKKKNEYLRETKVIYTDSTLFDVFTLPLLDGNAATALTEPNSIVINETMARKYFNQIKVAGKTLELHEQGIYKVTAVIKDIPANAHFRFDFFLPMRALEDSREDNWISNNFNTYIVLKKGADPKQLEAQFPNMVKKYVGPQVLKVLSTNLADFEKSGNHDSFSLTALTDIHLRSDKSEELGTNGSIQYVYIFSAIALFILLIACINFMNLSTARSSNRAKEVGIRKVMGSLKGSLIRQFLTESMLVSTIAMLLGMFIAWSLLPWFNNLSGKELTLNFNAHPWMMISMPALILFTGFLAGSYPAFYLSSFQPIQVIKGKLATGFKTSWLRSSLVVFQFSISIILIVGTLVIYNQLHFIQSRKPGFNREQVLTIHSTNALGGDARVLRDELLNMPGIVNATMTGFLPTSFWRNDSPLFTDPTLDQKNAVSSQIWQVDERYIPTLGMEMVSGRNFSKEFPSDSTAVIINEAAAKMMGFKDPLNKELYYIRSFETKLTPLVLHIVGVIKDFNYSSMHEHVTPLTLRFGRSIAKISARINTKDIPSLLSQIESKYKSLAPEQQFTYSFMDEDFDNIYTAEKRMGRISLTFSVLAILIACLGLFGLATYAAEQRTKEIGIRKVLGATVSNITTMLSAEFLKLVCIAALIAFPLAWWAMHSWLNNFAYRTNISWWIFAAAGVLAAFIAIVTVSFQAIRAALANPVKSLRSE